MLYQVELINFKRFEHEVFDLRSNVIVFVGPNSSGKSSLLKALLAFKQTWEDQSDHEGLLARGPYVNLGHFGEYVHKHESNRHVHFRFYVKNVEQFPAAIDLFDYACIEVVHERDPKTGHGRLKRYTFYVPSLKQGENTKDSDLDGSNYISYERMQKSEEAYKITISDSLLDELTSMRKLRLPAVNLLRDESSRKSLHASLRNGHIQSKRSTLRGMSASPTRQYVGEKFDVINILEQALLSPAHHLLYKDLTEKTFALGALRESPQRTTFRTDENFVVGSSGENTASVFLNLDQQQQKAKSKERTSQNAKARWQYSNLMEWIQRLDLAYRLRADAWRDQVDLRIQRDSSRDSTESIADVGMGVSQALPILVQAAVAPIGTSRLILEQPELHLFPWAQYELAKVLCEAASKTANTIFIETHSEHIIYGVQAHVSSEKDPDLENKLDHNSVNVLFFRSEGKIERLPLNSKGNFERSWPPGFFDQGLRAFKEITENQIEKRKAREAPEESY